MPALSELLYKLSVMHVIRYIPQDESSVIFIRHDSWLERTEAMRGYVVCSTCRG